MDGQGVRLLPRGAEQLHQVFHPAEIRSIRIDAAAPSAGVEMAAPAIGPHQVENLLSLLLIQDLQGIAPQGGIESATGATSADAAPRGL